MTRGPRTFARRCIRLLLAVARLGCTAFAGVLLSACEADVNCEIDHELRAVDLFREEGRIALRYEIRERRVWQQWPCLAHSCGDSEPLPTQRFDLAWTLPANDTQAPVPYTHFGPHDPEGARSVRDEMAKDFVTGKGAVRFTEGDRLGALEVLKYDKTLCWRALPCFVFTPDAGHVLAVDSIYSMDTGEPVLDLSSDQGFAKFVAAAVAQFSFVPGQLPGRRPSIKYALSNDLRLVVARPHLAGCLPDRDAQQRFNSVLQFDLRTRAFSSHASPAAQEGLQPMRHIQQVYFRAGAPHFVSWFGEWLESSEAPRCHSASEVLDFNVATGGLRRLDADSYLVGSDKSTDGAANFHTRFSFEAGVIELTVFDLVANRRRIHHLALPEAILDQVTPDKVRPGIADGEFIRR